MFRSLTLTPCPLSQGAHCTQGQTERVLALLEVIAPALPARRPVRVQASVRLRLDDGQEVVFGEQVSRGERWEGQVEAFKKRGGCRVGRWWGGGRTRTSRGCW